MHIYIVLTEEIHQDYIVIIIFVLTIYYKEFNALYVCCVTRLCGPASCACGCYGYWYCTYASVLAAVCMQPSAATWRVRRTFLYCRSHGRVDRYHVVCIDRDRLVRDTKSAISD